MSANPLNINLYFSRKSRLYRYSFNGKESDSEASDLGEGTQDYGFRIYNPSLGKFLSVDPLLKDFPMLSTYQFAANTPIQAIDLDGLENCHFSLVWDDEGRAHIKLLYMEPESFGVPTLVINEEYISDMSIEDMLQEVKRYSTISKKEYYEERQRRRQENQEFQEQRFDYLDNLGAAMAAGTVMKGSAKNPAPTSAKNAKKEPISVNAKDRVESLIKAGNVLDKGGFTSAGRALQKHGSRSGSNYPKATGNAAEINAQGETVLNGILTNPKVTSVTRHHARFGDVLEYRIPEGQGARFSSDGKTFIGFLE